MKRWLLNLWLHPWFALGAIVGAYARLVQMSAKAVQLGWQTGYGDDDGPA